MFFFAEAWEGFRAARYDANPRYGDWTIGYGHKIKPSENFDGKRITKGKAIELFHNDMIYFENRVRRNINVKLSQQQFDALVLFDMNVRGGLDKANKLREAVNGQIGNTKLRKIWYMYSDPNMPIIHQGLLNRRMDEFEIWTIGDYTRNY